MMVGVGPGMTGSMLVVMLKVVIIWVDECLALYNSRVEFRQGEESDQHLLLMPC